MIMAVHHDIQGGSLPPGGGRKLLIDVGNTKTALQLCGEPQKPAVQRLPTAALSAAAIRDFLIPSVHRSPSAAYSVAAAAETALAAEIAAANAGAAGRAAPVSPAAETVPAAPYSGEVKALAAPPPPAPVYVSSVVPSLNAPLTQWLAACGWTNVTFVSSARHHIIEHRLATPETTGTDRLLAALAVSALPEIRHKKEAVVLVQAGSAAVVDLIDKDGVFHGGLIMPGPQMWLGALAGAAQLPHLDPADLDWDTRGPGDSTVAAILGGAVAGLVGEIKEAVRRLLMALPGQAPLLVFTGGWGERMLPYFPGKYYPDLVLLGLDCFSRNITQKG